jgi:hypothetical protein
VVRAAQNKVLALAGVAQVTGDPVGPVLDSQIALLTAQYRLFEETKHRRAAIAPCPLVTSLALCRFRSRPTKAK